MSRVIIRVTPFRALITLLITYLLSPPPLQVGKIFVNQLQPFFEGLGVDLRPESNKTQEELDFAALPPRISP